MKNINLVPKSQRDINLILESRPTIKTFIKDYNELSEKIVKTIDVLYSYSQIDGAHHKAWCLDQIARIILGDRYDLWVKRFEYQDDKEELSDEDFQLIDLKDREKIYEWDIGIAP